ncbi:MAG: DNA cytosine methyltransferase [Saprospiraceae bacterium]
MSCKKKIKKEFKFIDLFAGIGGFHLAMHYVGGKCVFASEWDKYARITYEENYKSISPELFKKGDFNWGIQEANPSKIPDFDVLCAGFPSQPFSNTGLKKGFHFLKM